MSKTIHESFDLPDRWTLRPLSEIAESISPGFPCGDHNKEGRGVPHLRPMNISARGEISMSEVKYVEEEYDPLRVDDVLFNNTNSPVLVGKTAHVSKNEEWAYSNHMTRIRGFSDGVDSKWVANWLHFLFEDGYFRMHCRNHVNQASIGVRFLENKVDVPLPPLPEQRRIVAKIEELFSNLDAGRADLQTAQRQLERYRLSVLQAAVKGRLTADWRRTHEVEPADTLLERILVERRKLWEKDYRAKYEAKGKKPPSGWKSRYSEPDPPDTTNLRELPEGWTWTRLGQAFVVHLGATPRRSRNDYWDGKIAWASSSEINQRSITYTEESITEKGLENSSTQVLPPGTLMLGMIGQGRTRGMIAELKIPAATSQNSAAIEVSHSPVPSRWVYYYLESQYHKLRQMGSGNNQKALNKSIVESIPIPLPPLDEQKQIVAEVERLLSVADDAVQTVDREHTRAERLRQSILKQAFSGRLVPHENDSASEPALPLNGTGRTGEQIELPL